MITHFNFSLLIDYVALVSLLLVTSFAILLFSFLNALAMKTGTKTLLAALMLLAISCKKESNTIQSSGIAGESATQALSADAHELVGANAVRIGTQVWKKKNLDVTHYRNGDRIPQVKDPAKWASLTTGAWCWYNNDSANGAELNDLCIVP